MIYQLNTDVRKFGETVSELSGVDIATCYQCGKCTAGCPIVMEMSHTPNQIMRLIQLGLKEAVLNSPTIWLCASCETCTTRCPKGVDIAKIMDTMRMASLKSGMATGEKRVPIFHEAFLSSIKSKGRVYELGMIGQYTLKSGDTALKLKDGSLMEEAKLGWQMFKKGKLKLFPQKIRRTGEIKRLFKILKRGRET